jgi:hypothetical protein
MGFAWYYDTIKHFALQRTIYAAECVFSSQRSGRVGGLMAAAGTATVERLHTRMISYNSSVCAHLERCIYLTTCDRAPVTRADLLPNNRVTSE